MTATILAGIFLTVFGAAGAWFLTTRFPSAKFLRVGYAVMSASGVLFLIWSVLKVLAIGVAGAALLGAGAAIGIVGALRRELRLG
ncbi:MAG TPA: hypothetical protein VGG89_17125 [Candidatus Baltobacteraceae bacterium]